ncbi:MAG TPA: DUF4384 domain-containing protein [Thermoanaerobaculia bacterium]|jgi:hypothetical protein
MRTVIATAAALTFATVALAGEKGAKALFVDTTSGATIHNTNAKPDARRTTASRQKPRVAARRPEAPQPAAPVSEVSGLMYYVELVSPKGETSRVTTDRTFTSGERILLHVVSAIDGDVAVYQKTPNGQAARLFPDDRIRNGSGRIVKGVDTILPSPTSWFRFDDQPGTEELTIVLTPHAVDEAPPQTEPVLQMAALRYGELGPPEGSKGLVVETDSRGPAPATYVVRRAVSGRPPEPVVVTIQLKHR